MHIKGLFVYMQTNLFVKINIHYNISYNVSILAGRKGVKVKFTKNELKM